MRITKKIYWPLNENEMTILRLIEVKQQVFLCNIVWFIFRSTAAIPPIIYWIIENNIRNNFDSLFYLYPWHRFGRVVVFSFLFFFLFSVVLNLLTFSGISGKTRAILVLFCSEPFVWKSYIVNFATLPWKYVLLIKK